MPKTLVVIIIYNRFDNLKRWLECWSKCDKTDAELVVIHNTDTDPTAYVELCHNHGIDCFTRRNKGMDIGAFKDLCQGMYTRMPDYDNLIWITDDTIPMSKDFVRQFTEHLNGNIGLTCMEISNKNSPLHVRTTGFCISKETAEKLVFPDKITTKEDCYQFEHRGKNTLMLQIKNMGLECLQISSLATSPLWDTGNRANLRRWREHEKVFKSVGRSHEDAIDASKYAALSIKHNIHIGMDIGKPHDPVVKDKVVFICPIYNNAYPSIVTSMLNQTYNNWELLLIHDGPNEVLRDVFLDYPDSRVTFIETPKHRGSWGHYIRQEYLQKFEGDYVVITNADNYHVPVYIERMLAGFTGNIVATYCSAMVHSYTDWGVIPCQLKRGYIDCAGVMVRADVAKLVGWNDIDSHSSDWSYFFDIIKKYGSGSFKVVKGCLLIHN